MAPSAAPKGPPLTISQYSPRLIRRNIVPTDSHDLLSTHEVNPIRSIRIKLVATAAKAEVLFFPRQQNVRVPHDGHSMQIELWSRASQPVGAFSKRILPGVATPDTPVFAMFQRGSDCRKCLVLQCFLRITLAFFRL